MVLGYVNTGRTGRGKHIVFDEQVDYIVICIAGVIGINVIGAIRSTHSDKNIVSFELGKQFCKLNKKNKTRAVHSWVAPPQNFKFN